MANRTVKDARTVKGTNPQYLVEKIIRTRIYESKYWKEECFALSGMYFISISFAGCIQRRYWLGGYGPYKPRTGRTGHTGRCMYHTPAILAVPALIYSTHRLDYCCHFHLCSLVGRYRIRSLSSSTAGACLLWQPMGTVRAFH